MNILLIMLILVFFLRMSIKMANREKPSVAFMRDVLEVVSQRHQLLSNQQFREKLKKCNSKRDITKYLNEETNPTLMERLLSVFTPIREQRTKKVFQNVLDQYQESKKGKYQEIISFNSFQLKKQSTVTQDSKIEFLDECCPKINES